MARTKKKSDPLSERARSLNAEIAALEAQIKKLGNRRETAPVASAAPSMPRLRSTAMPHSAGHPGHTTAARHEPVFEKVDHERLKETDEPVTTPEHFNELGVRKYDLAAWFHRLTSHFHGPATANPRLVHYLAAGSVQGLRPMRYEKRVQRNRFLFVAAVALGLMIGIFAMLHHPR
jgi:hypothetical protein